jgi:hypothetical protein
MALQVVFVVDKLPPVYRFGVIETSVLWLLKKNFRIILLKKINGRKIQKAA